MNDDCYEQGGDDVDCGLGEGELEEHAFEYEYLNDDHGDEGHVEEVDDGREDVLEQGDPAGNVLEVEVVSLKVPPVLSHKSGSPLVLLGQLSHSKLLGQVPFLPLPLLDQVGRPEHVRHRDYEGQGVIKVSQSALALLEHMRLLDPEENLNHEGRDQIGRRLADKILHELEVESYLLPAVEPDGLA